MSEINSKTTLKKDYTDKPHESVPCPLCDAQDDYELATVGYPGIPVRNVICKGCGLVRINPRMTKKGYDDFYMEDFFEYLNPYGRPHYVNTIEKTTDDTFKTEAEKYTIPFVIPYVKEGGKVLDIGAGFGQILYLLRKLKHVSIYGIEPDPYSRQVAKEKIGIELSADTIEEFLAKNTEKYDYIHLEQVFEHLLDPLVLLKGIANMLTPEGVLYIGVPGTYNYAVAPDRFFELAHTYGYTPATLRLFAEKAGLKIILVRDPMSTGLDVLMTHKDATYPEEKEERMVQGADWKDTKNRLLSRKRYFELRGRLKKIIVSIFGEKIKDRLKKFLPK